MNTDLQLGVGETSLYCLVTMATAYLFSELYFGRETSPRNVGGANKRELQCCMLANDGNLQKRGQIKPFSHIFQRRAFGKAASLRHCLISISSSNFTK